MYKEILKEREKRLRWRLRLAMPKKAEEMHIVRNRLLNEMREGKDHSAYKNQTCNHSHSITDENP